MNMSEGGVNAFVVMKGATVIKLTLIIKVGFSTIQDIKKGRTWINVLLLVLLLCACGREDIRRQNCTIYGDQCHDTDEPEIIQGPKGEQGPSGAKGLPGKNGHSLTFQTLLTSSCLNGGHTVLMAVDLNDNNMVDPLIDGNLSSMEICNGQDGSNGTNGQDGADAPPSEFTPVEIVDPCSDAPNIFDEVFLRLFNGQLLWSLSDNANGLNTRFSLAVPGSWKTTDGSACFFSIDSSYNLYNEHY